MEAGLLPEHYGKIPPQQDGDWVGLGPEQGPGQGPCRGKSPEKPGSRMTETEDWYGGGPSKESLSVSAYAVERASRA